MSVFTVINKYYCTAHIVRNSFHCEAIYIDIVAHSSRSYSSINMKKLPLKDSLSYC